MEFADTPEEVGIDGEKLEALFERAERDVRDGLLPAVQIAIAREGKLAGMRTFGEVLSLGEPAVATNETLFCVFSCTKALTSAAAWLLIQEGKLDPSERAADIVPEFGSNGKDAITVEQLLTHTAGFPTAPMRPALFLDLEERYAAFDRWRLTFEPGSQFIYHPSSSMYVVGDIIERRSGLRYGEFIRERIAQPLGLETLWVGLPAAQHGRVADCVGVGEAMTDEDFRKAGFPPPPVTEVTEDAILTFNTAPVREAGIPGGGGIMTAADLALFYQALVRGGRGPDGTVIWQEDTLRDALRVRTGDLTDLMFRKPANRALGLTIAGGADRTYRGFGHTNSELAFGHGGAGGQIAWADPESGISIGYCTNGHDRNPIRMGRRTVGISSRAASLAR